MGLFFLSNIRPRDLVLKGFFCGEHNLPCVGSLEVHCQGVCEAACRQVPKISVDFGDSSA